MVLARQMFSSVYTHTHTHTHTHTTYFTLITKIKKKTLLSSIIFEWHTDWYYRSCPNITRDIYQILLLKTKGRPIFGSLRMNMKKWLWGLTLRTEWYIQFCKKKNWFSNWKVKDCFMFGLIQYYGIYWNRKRAEVCPLLPLYFARFYTDCMHVLV
jgi:hypothetical protein